MNKLNVPVRVAAKVYGKSEEWVRAGIISGMLPIGKATRNGKVITDISEIGTSKGRINYYISPWKLAIDTGYCYTEEVRQWLVAGVFEPKGQNNVLKEVVL